MATKIDFNDNEFNDFYEINKWNILCMKYCKEASELSKCAAKKVSAIIADNSSIYSIGVNGSFPGKVNCNEIFKKKDNVWYEINGDGLIECEDQELHHKWSLLNEVHAEINALTKMSKKGISTEGLDLYCTHSPCYNCAKNIIASGIKTVYFNELYDDYEPVMDLLIENNVNFIRIKNGEL